MAKVVIVNVPGPQGQQGIQGPIGPQGPPGNVITAGLVTTSSFYVFTASYESDSASFDERINNINVDTSFLVTTGAFYAFTGSYEIDSSSFDERLSAVTTDISYLVRTSSFNVFTASYTTGSFTGSFIGLLSGTSSWAVSASRALTSSFLTPGIYLITASWAQSSSQALTASYVTGSIFTSTNPALSASFALSSSRAISSSFATTSSFAVSASRSVSSSFATQAENATTADYATSAGSAASAGSAGSATTSDQIQISETFEPLDPDGNGLKPFLVPYTPGSGKYYSDLAETTFEMFPIKNQIFFRTSSLGQPAQLEIGKKGVDNSGYLIVYGELWAKSLNVLPGTIKFVDAVDTASFNSLTDLSYDGLGNRLFLSTGSFSGSFIGSLIGTSSWAQQSITSSFAQTSQRSITASYAETSSITYVSNSNFSLSEIEVADYSNDVAVTFNNGRLKFVFGTPVSQSISSFGFNSTADFETNRFNRVLDSYTVVGSWANNGFTFLTASIFTGSVLLTTTSIPNTTTLQILLNTSGSQSYRLVVSASSPLDGSVRVVSQSLAGILNKTLPGSPTINLFSTNVQLGVGGNQIEQGATGSISLATTVTGASNGWAHIGNTTNPTAPGTIFVTGSATGSASIIISATSSYSSSGVGGSDNDPVLTTSTFSSLTYTKIRSVRYAATATASFTSTQIENLALWTGSLGATEITGSILKGTVNPNNTQFTINTNSQYIYVIVDSAYTLTGILNVNNSNANDINVFTSSSVGNYRVYRSNNLSSTSILYRLTT